MCIKTPILNETSFPSVMHNPTFESSLLGMIVGMIGSLHNEPCSCDLDISEREFAFDDTPMHVKTEKQVITKYINF